MTEQATIRTLQPADIPAVTSIYAHYVHNSTATFEITPPGEDEMWRRAVAVLDRGLPFPVAERKGKAVGFAYAVPYRLRPAYSRTVESSVYVGIKSTGQGIGRRLMESLIADCRASGYHRLIAVIGGSENAASVALHEALGFGHVGTFSEAGFKFGHYVDTLLYELALD